VYLLTGENGTGKSTVLYALAELLSRASQGDYERLRARMRSDAALARVASGDLANEATRDHVRRPIGFPAMFPSSWAAFAYSGLRRVESARLQVLEEPREPAHEGTLSFEQTAKSKTLAQWVSIQDYKRLKAKDAGEHEAAERLGEAIRGIEHAIARVIDDDFAFYLPLGAIDVQVRWRGATIELDLLPDGLKSIVSWIADLLMRLERMPWVDDTPPRERPFLLLLDEIDIHLHPAWQRRILPMAQRLFPNAQIIATTHSPYVVASAADARILRFVLEGGRSRLDPTPRGDQLGTSVSAIQRDIFGIDSDFDIDTEDKLAAFREERLRLLSGASADRTALERLARELASRGEELRAIVGFELRQLDRQLGAAKHAAG